jgi:hypothetical protein
MRTLIEILAGLAILANAVIYGTDVFGAIVLRPAIAAVDDRTLTQLLGHVHRIADRRFAAIGTGGLIAAIAMAPLAAATGHWVSTAAGALATLALIIVLAVYTRIRLGRTRLAASRRTGGHGHGAARAGRLRPDPGGQAGRRVNPAAQAVGVLQRARLRRRAGAPRVQPGRPYPVDHWAWMADFQSSRPGSV